MVARAIGRITFDGVRWALVGSCEDGRTALKEGARTRPLIMSPNPDTVELSDVVDMSKPS
jgi:hypothetical protein